MKTPEDYIFDFTDAIRPAVRDLVTRVDVVRGYRIISTAAFGRRILVVSPRTADLMLEAAALVENFRAKHAGEGEP